MEFSSRECIGKEIIICVMCRWNLLPHFNVYQTYTHAFNMIEFKIICIRDKMSQFIHGGRPRL